MKILHGLNSISYRQGEVHFTSQITGENRISGNYAVKDFNTIKSKHPNLVIPDWLNKNLNND